MSFDELPERFGRLKLPVHKIKAETPAQLFQLMPGLRRYFQKLDVYGRDRKDSLYLEPRGLVKVITYIVLLYDPDSDIVDEYPDEPRLRKEAAAKDAGFKRTPEGEWPEDVQRIMDFEHPDVVDWILDYLKSRKSNTWREIVFLEEELDKIYRIRATDFDRAIKLKLDGESKTKIEELQQLKKQFYAEHSDLRKATEEELLPISPENVYKVLKIPEDQYRIKQVTDPDVSKPARLPEEDHT